MFSFSDTGMSWDFARHSGALFWLGRGGDRRNGGYLRHGAVHGGLPGMQIEGLGGGHLRVAQNAGEGEHIHAVLDGAGGKGVPLRYNYDKPEKPRRIKGFEVFSLVFSSFSKPKNHTEISRIIGGVSLTTNE